jgi:hypothetical protein
VILKLEDGADGLGDPDGAGAVGLEATKSTNGPWMIDGLSVEGFRYGINLGSRSNGRHMVSMRSACLPVKRSLCGLFGDLSRQLVIEPGEQGIRMEK